MMPVMAEATTLGERPTVLMALLLDGPDVTSGVVVIAAVTNGQLVRASLRAVGEHVAVTDVDGVVLTGPRPVMAQIPHDQVAGHDPSVLALGGGVAVAPRQAVHRVQHLVALHMGKGVP